MEKDFKWNAEMILIDALDNVLKNLNARDLHHAAQVCKSWNHATKMEFSRRGPERIVIPNPYNPTLQDPEFYVANIFRAKPNVVILFCASELYYDSTLDLELQSLNVYKNRFPNQTKLIIVSVDQTMKDEVEYLFCPENYSNHSDVSNILGLALPNNHNIEIKVAYCEANEQKALSLVEEVVGELMPEITDQKSILIIFGRYYCSIPTKILEIIKNRYNCWLYTLWGGMTNTNGDLMIINCKSGDFPNNLGLQGFICIRITGQSLEAHSTVVSCDLTLAEIAEKLFVFKNRLILRRHKLGLVCGPYCPQDRFDKLYESDAVLKVIKKIFPDISFTSYFNYSDDYYFGLDSTSEDPDQKLIHTKSLSIMILTYD